MYLPHFKRRRFYGPAIFFVVMGIALGMVVTLFCLMIRDIVLDGHGKLGPGTIELIVFVISSIIINILFFFRISFIKIR